MEFSEEQLKKLSVLFEEKVEKELTIEGVRKFVQLDTIDDCKQYLRVMLDFFFEVFKSPEGRKAMSSLEDERNIWLQTIFSKSCHFLYLLDGVGYNNGSNHLNPIIDPSVLFTIARRIYESVIAFELLFVIPSTEDEQTILYNLFMAQGLTERLNDLDEEMRSHNPQRVAEEQQNIDNCMNEIEKTELYSNLSQQTKNQIKNAFGIRYRYVFEEDNTMKRVSFEDAYKYLRIKKDLLKNTYSFFSLHGHPSYLALIQFHDACVFRR